MHPRSAWIFAAILLATCNIASTTFVKRSLPLGPEWKRQGPAPDSVTLHVGIRLPSDVIHDLITNISDPCHPQYAKYYNQSSIEQLIRPSDKAKRAVNAWLDGHGAEKSAAGHDWFTVEVPAATASRMLGEADVDEYEHESGARKLHVRDYALPNTIDEHIELLGVGGGSRGGSMGGGAKAGSHNPAPAPAPKHNPAPEPAPAPKHKPNHGGGSRTGPGFGTGAGIGYGAGYGAAIMRHHHEHENNDDDDKHGSHPCSPPYSLECLRAVHQMSNYTLQAPDKQRVMIAGFIGQHPSLDDLKKYLEEYNPVLSQVDLSTAINITDDAKAHGIEANLDLQIMAGNTLPTHITYYYTPGHADAKTVKGHKVLNEPYLEFFSKLVLLPDDELPQIVSISYSDVERTVDRGYAEKVCDYAALLGIRGTSVIVSSGDDGVGSDDNCDAKDPFLPTFPASCPYVTAVGGTKNEDVEQVASDTLDEYHSGSGFSDYFDRPAYQHDAVEQYLPKTREHKDRFNASGRAYPDLSLTSSSFAVFHKGNVRGMSGTSAATQLAAALFAMVNDARIAAGQPVLGFLNPILYYHFAPAKTPFRDIVKGKTYGCGGAAFVAAPGWDVASGLGAPLFDAIRDAALHVQCPLP